MKLCCRETKKQFNLHDNCKLEFVVSPGMPYQLVLLKMHRDYVRQRERERERERQETQRQSNSIPFKLIANALAAYLWNELLLLLLLLLL